jgi:hypothetical protein
LIDEKEFSGRHFTYAEITAPSEEELIDAVDNYKSRYPLQGYATREVFRKQLEGGLYLIRLERYSSCD